MVAMKGAIKATTTLFLLSSLSSSSAFQNYDSVISPAPKESTSFWQVEINEFFKKAVPAPFRQSISIFYEKDDELDPEDFITIITAAPSSPGFPRPLWAVLMASIPTGLFWYAYYKFAVEEELLQTEIKQGKEPRGLGGYGTLGPFTYGLLLGPIAEILDTPGGMQWSLLSGVYLFCSQVLLYERVNDLYHEEGRERPLQAWWSLPLFFPFNIIVGLRQVHFLSQYLSRQRGLKLAKDPVCDLFPFIEVESLTWQQFMVSPKLWCSWFRDIDNLDPNFLLPKDWQPVD
ncbi:unnamed protein product [Cylindrotheca closterium]|uniref:Uncharacterized protein n=1 Tax=Cylindrotheca closterium TaxID=2856 RepID=A0AAD2FLS9_9STRA|nr:unnamed protein product [Cylindrotheca closterium]